jgi:hypothetical protein
VGEPVTAVDDAWQAALAAEHQAAFGYPLLGPQLTGAQQALSRTSQAAHEALRDTTAARIAAAGLSPVAPLGDYAGLYPVDGAKAARALAVRLEADCAAAWRFLYAAAATDAGNRTLRAQAQQALTASAVRATRWRQAAGTSPATVAFPGI